MTRIAALLAILLFAAPADAQIKWPCGELPCIGDKRLNSMLHDAGHSLIAVGVAEGLRVFDSDWNDTDRYLLATVALPVLQETVDLLAFNDPDEWKLGPSDGSFLDMMTYQGAWLLPLIRKGKWWQAALVTVAWGGTIYWRYSGK